MKLAGVMIASLLSIHSYATPLVMRTGKNNAIRTQREKFSDVMAQIGSLPEQRVIDYAARAMQQEIAELGRILPEWCHQIPVSILVYVGFTEGGSQVERAKQYFRLALLVRDMYLDYPINQNTLLTLHTPQEQRLSDQVRYRLVARSLLEAYNLLQGVQDTTNADLIRSMADLGNWTLHYLDRANETESELAYEVALEMNRFANIAMLDIEHDVHNDPRLPQLARRSMAIIARNLAPALILLLTTLNVRGAKSSP